MKVFTVGCLRNGKHKGSGHACPAAASRRAGLFITTITTTVQKAVGNVPSAKPPDYLYRLGFVAKFHFCT